LLSLEIVSPGNGAFIPAPRIPIHSDYHPVLEYLAQRAFFASPGSFLPSGFDEKFSSRPDSLFAQYLQQHPLSEDDFRAFGLFKMTRRLPNDQLFRSLLLRWLTDYPQSTTAIELSSKAGYYGIPEELEAQRMRVHRDLIWGRAEKEPELLRNYALLLRRVYTHARSVFFRPPSEELEQALRRLIEVDAENQRIYQLYLAELAWDRKDDDAFFRLAQAAFSPEPKMAGKSKFNLDRAVPKRVLARMIETFWRSGKPAEAWDLCQQVRSQGYLDPRDVPRDLLLELTYRKVETLVTAARSQP
jgi:hypothetical protein